MQGSRIFAYVTMILVVALLVLVTTQGLFVFIQPGDPRAWLVLFIMMCIYFSVTYGVSRRFARKPMRPPTMPLITGVLMILPPLVLNMVIENDILFGTMYWSYVGSCAVGSGFGAWYGMQAGWRTLIESLAKQKKLSQD
jgi:drug/metabolite transporter (DMT)-like permease